MQDLGDPPIRRSKGVWSRTGTLAALFLAVLLGVLVGVGTYTFSYAQGFSYFKRDPRACVNCHIMQPQYDSWQKSSHHTAAVCVDCHLPHDFVPKYVAKSENGFRHGLMFTTQNFVEPIVIQPAARRILEDNCRLCHSELVAGIEDQGGDTRADHGAGMACLHCHSGVGHGPPAGLGGPFRASEVDDVRAEERDRAAAQSEGERKP